MGILVFILVFIVLLGSSRVTYQSNYKSLIIHYGHTCVHHRVHCVV
jgi:hypothetical protein